MSFDMGDALHYPRATRRATLVAMEETATNERERAGWLPYAMLGYLALYLVPPALEGAGALVWAATLAGAAACVALYVGAVRARGRRRAASVVGLVALGLVFVPSNPAALVFFIYAGLLIPHVARPGVAWAAITGLVVVVLAQAWWLGLPLHVWFTAALCSAVAGVVNVNVVRRQQADARLRAAREDVERVAKDAERERIARDLHDVLGHTMSVIVLKSELAAKLVDRDAERAKAEIRDVERISRDALAEIREAIRGYRSDGLAAELDRARRTLETAGVALACDADTHALAPETEHVLALVLREAVTNVVRHAGASACRIGLARTADGVRLEVADDGRGAAEAEGNGVRGMRERVEALGGSLRLNGGTGTTLTAELPRRGARGQA
jgi:two-component system sensor histidine kinase DesK